MSLSTITHNDAKPKNRNYAHLNNNLLKTEDIEGAKPLLKSYQFVNRPVFTNYIDDIGGAKAFKRFDSPERLNYSLITDDILNKPALKTRKIAANPLNPHYLLPAYEVKPATPPRHLRDTNKIDDIPGTSAFSHYTRPQRHQLSIQDIEGSKVSPKRELNKPDFHNPKDINTIEVWETGRVTNPLMPSYVARDENGNIITIGEVDGSKPKPYINIDRTAHNRHLKNDDIDGSKTGTVNAKRTRSLAKNPFDSIDIDGATAGSLKRGMTTQRMVNPLNPSYT